jgi:crotonobetainyl-CoA:carnitine CoA-transferase CaiB-like acyl-CoA transferase
MLAAANDRLFIELARRLELPVDERFATNASRVAHREELAALLQERLEREPTAVWLGLLRGIPIAPVQTIREAAEHWHTRSLGIVQTLDGRRRIAEPLRIDGERVRVEAPPPELGQPAR